MHRLAGRHLRLHAVELVEVLAAAPDVLAGRDPQPLDLVVVAQVPGQVLGAVLGRLGREVAEPPVHVDPHAPAQLGVALDGGVDQRVEVLAVALEAEDERLVVDAGADERDLVERHAGDLRQLTRRVLHRVAEPDDARRRRARVRDPAEHRHRVRVVEEPRARADLGHVVADAEHHRRRAQRADDAADAERVADRLAQAVAERHLVVADGRVEAADLHRVDHVVGAVERRAPVERGGHVRAHAEPVADQAGDPRGRLEPLRIDVVERDLRVRELREGEDVADQVARELDAAGSDEGDLGHKALLEVENSAGIVVVHGAQHVVVERERRDRPAALRRHVALVVREVLVRRLEEAEVSPVRGRVRRVAVGAEQDPVGVARETAPPRRAAAGRARRSARRSRCAGSGTRVSSRSTCARSSAWQPTCAVDERGAGMRRHQRLERRQQLVEGRERRARGTTTPGCTPSSSRRSLRSSTGSKNATGSAVWISTGRPSSPASWNSAPSRGSSGSSSSPGRIAEAEPEVLPHLQAARAAGVALAQRRHQPLLESRLARQLEVDVAERDERARGGRGRSGRGSPRARRPSGRRG